MENLEKIWLGLVLKMIIHIILYVYNSLKELKGAACKKINILTKLL